uniref:polynucleotide adenylyltransferase n=1 Tax=Arundo donax TaxID=35708 RepID=A0A0A9D3R0_ARUDO
MYLPGPPPPGVLLPRPIVYQLNPAAVTQMDECRSRSLVKFISGAGVVPSIEDGRRRDRVVRELGKIVMDWAKRVAYEQGGQYWITSATVLTFGSYALGAYGPESDIDAVCVGPYIASLQHHFFIVLRQMLEGRPEVSELHSIEGAKVPLMRFKFNGILVDFAYVQLPVINAAEAIHAFDPRVLEKVDGASWRCLSGVRVNRQIIQLVPNMKKFQYLLRCLKLWARKRGLHCHLLGFFAGIHLAILAAYVCRRHPNASINTLFSLFFDTFVHWPWPLPVSLLDPPALCQSPDGCSLMPIMLPCIPPEFCSSSITDSTFNKIKEELRRGHTLTKDIRSIDIDWSLLFAPFPYGAKYKCFIRIVLSAPMAEELRDWVGWVKSRFRNLLLKLKSLGVYCDPDPCEQVDHTITDPNVVFFWGLMYRRSVQICTSSLKEDFMKSVFNNIYGKEKCAHSDITMSIVGPPMLPKSVFAQFT